MSPMTINKGIIMGHSVDGKNITLVLFSRMSCSDLFCKEEKKRGGGRGKKKERKKKWRNHTPWSVISSD